MREQDRLQEEEKGEVCLCVCETEVWAESYFKEWLLHLVHLTKPMKLFLNTTVLYSENRARVYFPSPVLASYC